MSTQNPSSAKAAPRRPKAGVYRGVTLRTPAAPPNISIHQIKKAVRDAIAKNVDRIAPVK